MKFLTHLTLLIAISITSKAQNIVAENNNVKLSVFAESRYQWTGIAVSKNNRVFVNFPRWSKDVPISVGEVVDGKVIPFPNQEWNSWDKAFTNKRQFICVQSMLVDDKNHLWILDTGYELATDSTKQAALYCIDIKTKKVVKQYDIPAVKISSKSYLNDFRIDTKSNMVYFTDSQVGGIVLLNLQTKEVRRVLGNHPSTLTEVDKIVIEGYERKHPVHSDGIELDTENGYLYYCSLMGKNLYRIPTKYLLDTSMSENDLGKKVETFAQTDANDGLWLDKKGNIYLSSLEKSAISKVTPQRRVTTVISHSSIKWPDSFAADKKGNLYFTTSQIHLPKEKRESYKIFKMYFKDK
jgi:sugar lactone lactonase YvrE